MVAKTLHWGCVEVTTSLVFENWQLGKEYTKLLNVKNTGPKAKKIKFRIPSTRFFVTLYPKPIILSPGTTFQLPITFKPMENIRYIDAIEFYSKEESLSFKIGLLGELPKHVLHCPEVLNINICAVGESVTLPFEVTNKTNMRTEFCWVVEEPFAISPQTGYLNGNSSLKCQLKFAPKEARTYCMESVLVFGETASETKNEQESTRSICKLSGIGKFPHISVKYEGVSLLKDDRVSFGPLPPGKRIQKTIQLVNMSPASTRFRIRRRHLQIRNVDKAFKLSLKEGTLAALGFLDVDVTFEPSCAGMSFEDHFVVEPTCLASKAAFTLSGSCICPLVAIQPNVLEFGCTPVVSPSPVLRTFIITNHSPLSDAVYEVLVDNTVGVFKFSSTNGTLKPGENKQLSVSFSPPTPINFYRRVTVLVSHHDPLMIDLLGTAYSIDVRPPALKAETLVRYRAAVDRGLARYFPEHLQNWLEEGKIKFDDAGALEVVDAAALPEFAQPAIACADLKTIEEYFDDGFHSAVVTNSPFVSFDRDYLYLNKADNSINKPQTIHLTNHTFGKIFAQFAIVPENEKSPCPFVIEPMKLDVPAGRSASFTVRLSDEAVASFSTLGNFLSANIECYCYHTVQREHTLVPQELVMPPWCLLLNIVGSTYSNPDERAVPVALSFNPIEKIFFPPLAIGETAYRSVTVNNKLDLPALISFDKLEDESFEIKPKFAVIRPGATILTTVRYRPIDALMLTVPLNVNINESLKNLREMSLIGSAEPPDIVLDDGDLVFIAPTCINSESCLPYTIRNSSRQRVEFHWHIPVQFRDVIHVRPSMGSLDVRGFQTCYFIYTPKTESRQKMRVRLSAKTVPLTGLNTEVPSRDYNVRLLAQGCVGTVVAQCPSQDYGSLRVGRSQRMSDFIVTNTSECPVRIRLVYQQRIEPLENEHMCEPASNKNVLSMEPDEFNINPHCEQHVIVHVRPRQRCRYSFKIAYQLLDNNGNLLPPIKGDDSPSEKPIAVFTANGIFPQIFVSDIQASGSARLVTKRHLWQLLSLDDLNACLNADPHESEMSKSRRSFLRHSARRRLEVSSPDDQQFHSQPRSYIQWDLGAMPHNTDPWKVHLIIQNSGALDVEWQFLFPTDLLVDIQPWAENLDFDEEELHEMMIVDNKLFDISPRQGVLPANGGQQMITVTFRHQFIGSSRLPVLFKITDGREVLLTLCGASVADDMPYLYLPKTRFCLAPIAIGDPSPPIQPLELFNGGRIPVNFSFDMTAISALTEASFGYSVFTCLTPTGVIQPGKVFDAQFKFSPLEARTYAVDVPLRVEHGDMHMLTIVGLGYDRRELGDSAPDFPEPGLANPPSVQAVDLPNQPARLSLDRLQLGNVPLFVRVSRAVLLHNLRLDSDLAFEWKVTDEKFISMVDVEPASGVLKPGQTNVCQVTFTATPPAAFHEAIIVCLLSPHADVNAYRQKLSIWEAERDAQLLNLGLDNDRDTATPRVDMVEMSPEQAMDVALQPRFGRLCEAMKADAIRQGKGEPRIDPRGTAPETSFHTLTIPPLLRGENEALYFAERYLERAALGGKLYPKPLPPQQTVLQLAVTARTHDPTEFTQAFGPDAKKHFVTDLTLVDETSLQIKSQPSDSFDNDKIKVSEAEISVITEAMGVLLMKTLKEADMKDVFKAAVSEPTPNYIEMLNVPAIDGAPEATPPPTPAARKRQEAAPDTAVILDAYLSSVLCSLVDDAVSRRFDVTLRPRLKAVPAVTINKDEDKPLDHQK